MVNYNFVIFIVPFEESLFVPRSREQVRYSSFRVYHFCRLEQKEDIDISLRVVSVIATRQKCR